MLLHDRTRRILLIALFYLFGPVLLLAVLGMLYVRSGTVSAARFQESLSQQLKLQAELSRVEYVRFGERRLLGVRLFPPEKDEPFLFCPEMYLCRKKTPLTKEQIETFYQSAPEAALNHLKNKVSSEQKTSSEPVFRESLLQSNPFSLVTSEKSVSLASSLTSSEAQKASSEKRTVNLSKDGDSEEKSAQNYYFTWNDFQSQKSYFCWTIPKIYVKASSLPQLKACLLEQLEQLSEDQNQLVFFCIDELIFLNKDEDFQKIVRDFDCSTSSLTPKDPFASANSDQLIQFDASSETIQHWISDFDTSLRAFHLTRIKGFWGDFVRGRQWSVQFNFDRIPIEKPVRLAIFHEKRPAPSEKEQEKTRLYLNASACPIPCSFAASFCPVFQLTSLESWINGNFVAEWNAEESFQRQVAPKRYEIGDFHLYRCDVAPLAQRVMTKPVSGTIADFYLSNATIEDGIFNGTGSIFLKKGAFDQRFLQRLADHYQVLFSPADTLNQIFPDGQVPFDEFAIEFEMFPQGIRFDSQYSKRIIGFYERSPFSYGIYLNPEKSAQKDFLLVSYPELLALLGMEKGQAAFWSPLYRDALNHLPTAVVPGNIGEEQSVPYMSSPASTGASPEKRF